MGSWSSTASGGGPEVAIVRGRKDTPLPSLAESGWRNECSSAVRVGQVNPKYGRPRRIRSGGTLAASYRSRLVERSSGVPTALTGDTLPVVALAPTRYE